MNLTTGAAMELPRPRSKTRPASPMRWPRSRWVRTPALSDSLQARSFTRWLPGVCVVACTLLALAACSRSAEPARDASANRDRNAFTILAGSELKELAPAIEATARQAGVPVKISYSGTLEMVDRINAGERFDAILPPNGAYPSLALSKAAQAKEKLFYSRVALGIKESKARTLGWDASAPSWSDITKAVRDGKLTYGMTNPTSSNTGMSALFAVACSVAGKTEDLTAEEVDREVLKDFLKGQKLTAGSSGWLADAFLREQDTLDGLVNYEAVILRLNDRPELREKLTLIYPRDGVISADYPLLLLNASKREGYDKLVAALKAKEFQSAPLAHEFLRPSNLDATRAPKLPEGAVAELTFPNRLEVIDAVLLAYQDELRRPSTSIYVLDVSGSMEGPRIAAMKNALRVLTGADAGNSVAARFARFQNRERVVLLPFSSRPRSEQTFVFDNPQARDATGQSIREYSDRLEAGGGTAIYDALENAYRIADEEQRSNPDRLVTIVLLTDGENTEGAPYGAFRARFGSKPATVRTFPILFGEARVQELEDLAQLTGGRVFEGRGADLTRVFREIRGYQ
jgi:Ca-activated chloride channel homolog